LPEGILSGILPYPNMKCPVCGKTNPAEDKKGELYYCDQCRDFYGPESESDNYLAGQEED
jgi:hypothetical protein